MNPEVRKYLSSIWFTYMSVILLLSLFFFFAVSSMVKKSTTFDEVFHLFAGFVQSEYQDFRIAPETGYLPNRWSTLGLLGKEVDLPSTKDPLWVKNDQWKLISKFFYDMGNDVDAILFGGRMMIAIVGVILGLLVYLWSTELFGKRGGLVSLILFAFSPTMIAHSALVTSDLFAALFFLSSSGALWKLMHKVTPLWLFLSITSIMGLLLSKVSWLLILPIALILLISRFLTGQPLVIEFGWKITIKNRWRMLVVFMKLLLVHVVIAVFLVWAAYGFRYSAFSPDQDRGRFIQSWPTVLNGSAPLKPFLEFAKEHQLLPEAWLYGIAFTLKESKGRRAYLNGEFRNQGWVNFFPLTLLYKTPLSLFGLLALAMFFTVQRWHEEDPEKKIWQQGVQVFYPTLPLWVLLVVYWLVSVNSNLNIGHRHILPTYPVMFILCGAVGGFSRKNTAGVIAWMVPFLICLFVLSSLSIRPNYLTYFNILGGGPENGWRHLVDSSIDWGQDLPGLKDWLGENQQKGESVYLSYFGTGNPKYYGINAQLLACHLNQGRSWIDNLTGGCFCVSATMLSGLYTDPVVVWNASHETEYRKMIRQIKKLNSEPQNKKNQLLNTKAWQALLSRYDNYRTSRLFAYLRRHEPIDNVGHSILIYRLTDQQVGEALFAPLNFVVP